MMITYHSSPTRRDLATSFMFQAEAETNEARIRRLIAGYIADPSEASLGILSDEAITIARNMDRSVQAMDDLAQSYRSE